MQKRELCGSQAIVSRPTPLILARADHSRTLSCFASDTDRWPASAASSCCSTRLAFAVPFAWRGHACLSWLFSVGSASLAALFCSGAAPCSGASLALALALARALAVALLLLLPLCSSRPRPGMEVPSPPPLTVPSQVVCARPVPRPWLIRGPYSRPPRYYYTGWISGGFLAWPSSCLR